MINEGYVKFNALLQEVELPVYPGFELLNRTRTELHDLGLIGAFPNGIGFGNLSMRIADGDEFLISATATGAERVLPPAGYCRVDRVELDRNRVHCSGQARASSETMSHAAVYQARADAVCVIHIHSRRIFERLLAEDYPCTPRAAEFGTPAIARAIEDLVAAISAPAAVFAMGGHEEGVIAYGPSIPAARDLLLNFTD